MQYKTYKLSELPQRFSEIPDPPEKLHVLGELPSFSKYKFLAVVGSRMPDSYAKAALDFLLDGLRGYPICVVSGLALGTDALSHKKALALGLKTIAFPGSGLSKDVLYPKSNINLAEQIIKQGGALVSEYDFKQKADKWTFPKRNRLMVAASDAVLIIQAKEKSGTLITARLAVEYGKDLLVVPNNIFDENYKGNLQFLKLGAMPATSSQDILDALNLKADDKNENANSLPDNLSSQEFAILQNLDRPKNKQELLEDSGLSAVEFNIAFSKLELLDLITEKLGKVFKNAQK